MDVLMERAERIADGTLDLYPIKLSENLIVEELLDIAINGDDSNDYMLKEFKKQIKRPKAKLENCVVYWQGENSQGTSCRIACRLSPGIATKDIKYYFSSYNYNGYNYCYSSWSHMNGSFDKVGNNCEIPCGFKTNSLRFFGINNRIKLPKLEN